MTRQNAILLSAFALFCVANSQAQERGESHPNACEQESAPLELERMARLASQWDYMRDAMLAQAGPGDHRSRMGTVLDESCLRGLSAQRRQARIARLEEGLAGAIRQMRGCGSALGFREASDVIAVLRRTRVSCGSLGQSGMGVMQTEFECPKSKLRMSAGATRRYEMTLAVPVGKRGEPVPGMSFEDWDIEELSSVMAHEAMHVLAMNNRSWHNSLEGRAKSGCDRSVFYDRVYFTETACFPRARSGPQFYGDGGPYQCPEVCMAALTEVDEQVRAESPVASSLRASSGVYGPSTVALPYPVDEARRICERVRQVRGNFPLPLE